MNGIVRYKKGNHIFSLLENEIKFLEHAAAFSDKVIHKK